MFAIDQWDWVQYALGAALILCNIGVWRGVALEESVDRFDKEVGKTLLIRSLAWEAFFAAVLFVASTASAVHQKSEIADLEAKNLQLAAVIQPRHLTTGQIALLKKAVRPFINRQISVWSYGIDVEARLLAQQIKSALDDEYVPVVDRIGAMISSSTPRIGVIVTGPDDALVNALLGGLKPLAPTRGTLPNNPGSHSQVGVDLLQGPTPVLPAEIFVGIKPLPK